MRVCSAGDKKQTHNKTLVLFNGEILGYFLGKIRDFAMREVSFLLYFLEFGNFKLENNHRRNDMFELKEKMLEIYNEGDKKIPLERYRSEGVKYIQDNIRSVAYDSITRTYLESGNRRLIDLPDLFNSVRFNQLDQWNFDMMIDKSLIYEKQNRLRQNEEIYGMPSLIYRDATEFSENDLIRMQVRLESDVEKFIDTNFTEYLGKLVRRK